MGDYDLEFIAVPGHTQGHMCLCYWKKGTGLRMRLYNELNGLFIIKNEPYFLAVITGLPWVRPYLI